MSVTYIRKGVCLPLSAAWLWRPALKARRHSLPTQQDRLCKSLRLQTHWLAYYVRPGSSIPRSPDINYASQQTSCTWNSPFSHYGYLQENEARVVCVCVLDARPFTTLRPWRRNNKYFRIKINWVSYNCLLNNILLLLNDTIVTAFCLMFKTSVFSVSSAESINNILFIFTSLY